MENKVSVISIILKEEEAAGEVNRLLHEFREYIVGRMGIPWAAWESLTETGEYPSSVS